MQFCLNNIKIHFPDNQILLIWIAHAGEGALSVTIRAAGQEVKHSIQDLANGQFDILFYPTMAIPHKFDVKYNGLPITSSPVEAKVGWLVRLSEVRI